MRPLFTSVPDVPEVGTQKGPERVRTTPWSFTVKLTDRIVAGLACEQGRRDTLVFDDALKGFAVRVQESGRKTFLLQYRLGGVRRRIVVGDWGTTDATLSTAEARKKAEVLRGRVREGRDPWLEQRETIEQARAAQEAERERAAALEFTVAAAIDAWREQGLAGRSTSYRHNAPKRLAAAFAKHLEKPATELTAADGRGVLASVATGSGPIAANRVRAYARACFRWHEKQGTLTDNPMRLLPAVARERPRERALSDDELASILQAAEALRHAGRVDHAVHAQLWAAFVWLLVLTGQRRGEVAGMRWDELSQDASGLWTWRIPAARSKNGRAHDVPLPIAAIERLLPLKAFGDRGLVLNPISASPLSGFGRFKRRLDERVAKDRDPGHAEMEPWTWHDLRRTCATGLQRLGVRLEVTEAVLNHISGSRAGIVGVYQRYQWREEKRAALESWASHVLALSGLRRPQDG